MKKYTISVFLAFVLLFSYQVTHASFFGDVFHNIFGGKSATVAPSNLGASATIPAPTINLTANPSSFPATGARVTTITWSTTGTPSCTASSNPTGQGSWTGGKYYGGSDKVSVSATTTYTLTCTNAGGTTQATTTVTVAKPTTPVATPSITVLSPNGGEVYQAGQQITVKWNSKNFTGNIAEINLIDVNGWGGGTGMTYDKQIPNTGTYTLTLPSNSDFSLSHASFGKYFRIEINGTGAMGDSSDNLFTINGITLPTSSITVLSPNGGETYNAGDKITVKWKSSNAPADQHIGITLEHLQMNGETQAPSDANGSPVTGLVSDISGQVLVSSGSAVVTLPRFIQTTGSNYYRITVFWWNTQTSTGQNDRSDNYFTITPSTTTTTPSITSSNCDNSSIPVKLIMTGLDSNGGSGDPISNGSQKATLGRFVLYPTCDLKLDKLEIYNTDYFASQGFSKYYIHLGYDTNVQGASTGAVIGELSSSQNMGGIVTLTQPINLKANTPVAINVSGDVKSGTVSKNTFQMCIMGPGNNLKDSNGNVITQLPGNVLPTTILGRMSCGKFTNLK